MSFDLKKNLNVCNRSNDKIVKTDENEIPKLDLIKVVNKTEEDDLFDPPLPVYKPKVTIDHDQVNFGLNMCFKKYDQFSWDKE